MEPLCLLRPCLLYHKSSVLCFNQHKSELLKASGQFLPPCNSFWSGPHYSDSDICSMKLTALSVSNVLFLYLFKLHLFQDNLRGAGHPGGRGSGDRGRGGGRGGPRGRGDFGGLYFFIKIFIFLSTLM